jgi:hypothetical protein
MESYYAPASWLVLKLIILAASPFATSIADSLGLSEIGVG